MSNIAALLLDGRGSDFEIPKTRIRSGTLPSGITAKMDAFARHVAKGMSLADAYRHAFNTAQMKPRTVSNEASRLVVNPGVSAAIDAYRAEIEARNHISSLERSDRIWAGLWALAENEDIAPSVRVKALHLAAQLCGMFDTIPNEQPISSTEIGAELARRLRSIGA